MNSSEPFIETLPAETDAVSAPDAATLEEQTGHQLLLSVRADMPEGVSDTRAMVGKLLEGFAWQKRLLHVHGADQNHALIADVAVPSYYIWTVLHAHVRDRAIALGLQNVVMAIQS